MTGPPGNEFARQLAERNAELNGTASKKFRSSAAPKGTKLSSGYQDRTQLRISEAEDEKYVRVKALEELVKLGQMAPETFEALRNEIIGGDLKDAHLVKGLDYRLLERVKRGEDVLSGTEKPKASEPFLSPPEAVVAQEDVDKELEKLESKEIQPLIREEKLHKENAEAKPILKKRTRDDILRDLRASRAAAAEEAKARLPKLSDRFKKVGVKREEPRIERDAKGREVLIIKDEDGNVKRKIRKQKFEDDTSSNGLLMPDKDLTPLGMDPPIAPAPEPGEDDDADIFGEVGKDYNPLAGLKDEEEDSEDEGFDNHDKRHMTAEQQNLAEIVAPPASTDNHRTAMPPPPMPAQATTAKKRVYFDDTIDNNSSTATESNPLKDPTILAALKKASTINPLPTGDATAAQNEEAIKLARHKKMLEINDRDAEDMDMGFGSSRFDDQEDGEDARVKLSNWQGEGEDNDGKRDGKKERKRGPKKRKGDKHSAADVLKIMETKKQTKT